MSIELTGNELLELIDEAIATDISYIPAFELDLCVEAEEYRRELVSA
jgi:hypothetical protein